LFVTVVRAYLALIYFDFCLARGNFSTLCAKVRECPVQTGSRLRSERDICDAMDLALIWYWKKVLCLQRSAAATCLLRRYGVQAHLVMGAQQMPFRAHAWVEVDGRVVNDKPYTPEMFAVIDRC
jgi:hypothetical protein